MIRLWRGFFPPYAKDLLSKDEHSVFQAEWHGTKCASFKWLG